MSGVALHDIGTSRVTNYPPGKESKALFRENLVSGKKNGMYMNPGVAWLSSYAKQEEAYRRPFSFGVAPNWVRWQEDGSNVILEEGVKPGFARDAVTSGPIYNPEKAPYYQVLRIGPENQGAAGTYRRFVGLHPGHTYRVFIRLKSFVGPADDKPWCLSVHACYNTPARDVLSAAQLVGRQPLPSGDDGEDAGQLAAYSGTHLLPATNWTEVNSGATNAFNKAGDITLPADVDSITVWLCLSGESEVELGMDWLALEDLTLAEQLKSDTKSENK